MHWYLLLIIVLSYQVNVGSGCKVAVDCGCVEDVDGVELVDCPDGKMGSGVPKDKIPVECCKEYEFTGPLSEHYLYSTPNSTCPVFLEFLEIDLDAGETVTVRNVFCQEEEGCKMMVIDEDAESEVPFTLPVSASYFSFASSRDEVYVKFRIVNEECTECQEPCAPMWHHHDGYCYYLANQQRTWDWHNNKCQNTLDSSMVQIYDQSNWDFVFDLGGHLRWIGLHCIDINNTGWYYDDKDLGNVQHTTPDIWEPGYPQDSIDAHCAYFGFNNNGLVRNTNCNTMYKSMCMKPAE